MNTIENTHMKKELLDLMPDWCKDFEPDNYYLVLTDDADSCLSCQRLKTLFGLEVGGFYDFKKGLFINDKRTDNGWKSPIFVDLSVSEGYAFDNHYSFINNPNKANPNLYKRTYYNQKYCGGTLMFIASLYGGVDKLSEKLRTALIAVDGFYIGYYNKGGKYRNINLWWLDKLGLTDYLLPILEKHDMQYFRDFILEYQLGEKIWIDDEGYLHCHAFGVPGVKFENQFETEQVFTNRFQAMKMHKNGRPIFVSAATYENDYVLNIKKIS